MAPWIFTKAILLGQPIRVFNNGQMQRDFTYIDDIVAGVLAAIDRPPADDGSQKPGGSRAPHAIYNLGNNRPEALSDFIAIIERATGKSATRLFEPMQPGDVPATFADIADTTRDLGYRPTTPLEAGIPKFVEWFRSRYGG
jgi:UDP-glucuronate 4-epimerase